MFRILSLQVLTILVCFVFGEQPCFSQGKFKPPVFDSATRLAFHESFLKMRESSPFKSKKWTSIGPSIMSGRVTDIARPLDQPHTIYVASASGGTWKTTNEGTTWKPIFDDAPSASTGAIAVDPQDSNIVWLGTGESNIFRSSMAGTGVYRSSDAGETWQSMGLADTHHIARIVVHPKDSNTVYIAACGHEYSPNSERGIFKTTDGGKTWVKSLYEDDMTGGYDFVMDPQEPNTLYASMWHRIRRPWSDPLPGNGGGVYRTDDGGKNWKLLTNGLPPRGKAGRIGIALAQSQPQTIYALVDNHEAFRKAKEGELDSYGRQKQDVIKGAEVFRSDDRGETWRRTHNDNEFMQRLFSTYGWVFGQIRVDPNDPETIYVMGVSMGKSNDGGKTFAPVEYPDLHGDHHALWIDPSNSNYLINGNDGGVNLSYDGGKTWKNIENMPLAQFYNVAIDNAEPFNVYGSIQDNMSWMGPSRPGRDGVSNEWKLIPGGEAGYIEIDPNDETTLYSESFYGTLLRSTRSSGPQPTARRRSFGGWETKMIKPEIAGETLRGQWHAPFQLSPHDSKVIYHGMNRVFRSTNRGDSWETISPDLTHYNPKKQGNISFATLSSLSESPQKAGLLYAGTDDGRLHVTQDGGKTWTEIVDGLPPHKWVSRVAASKYNESTVFLAQNGKTDNDFQAYVYRSDDYGRTWKDIVGNLPGGPVNVIKEDPHAKDVLYVGTDLGVFVSKNGGSNWEVLGSGLPITFVHDLIVHQRDKVMVIATHGRGMFTLDVADFSGEKTADKNRTDENQEKN